MTYTVKRESIEERVAREMEETAVRRENERVRGARLFKRLIGALLIVLAAVFGRFVGVLPIPVAFFTVFTYLCIEAALWIDLT